MQLPAAEEAVLTQLLPQDDADMRNIVLEIRAGAGGDEAALFAAALLRMYELFCSAQGWRFEVSYLWIISAVALCSLPILQITKLCMEILRLQPGSCCQLHCRFYASCQPGRQAYMPSVQEEAVMLHR